MSFSAFILLLLILPLQTHSNLTFRPPTNDTTAKGMSTVGDAPSKPKFVYGYAEDDKYHAHPPDLLKVRGGH